MARKRKATGGGRSRGEPLERRHLWLPAWVWQELEQVADLRGERVSLVVREVLRDWGKRQQKHQAA